MLLPQKKLFKFLQILLLVLPQVLVGLPGVKFIRLFSLTLAIRTNKLVHLSTTKSVILYGRLAVIFTTLHYLRNLQMGPINQSATLHQVENGRPGTNTLAYLAHLYITKKMEC